MPSRTQENIGVRSITHSFTVSETGSRSVPASQGDGRLVAQQSTRNDYAPTRVQRRVIGEIHWRSKASSHLRYRSLFPHWNTGWPNRPRWGPRTSAASSRSLCWWARRLHRLAVSGRSAFAERIFTRRVPAASKARGHPTS